MIELREEADGRLSRGYGGDTFNTAAYLARLGTQTDYITALGDDSWSDELIAAWNAEGVGTQRVLRLPGRLPGLYIIQTDPKGERRFSYWRETAAARLLFQAPEGRDIIEAIGTYDLAYLSGISLSLYGDSGRERGCSTCSATRGPTAGAWPSIRISAPEAGPISISRGLPSVRPSNVPTLFSPRRKTSTSCSAATVRRSC